MYLFFFLFLYIFLSLEFDNQDDEKNLISFEVLAFVCKKKPNQGRVILKFHKISTYPDTFVICILVLPPNEISLDIFFMSGTFSFP